MTDTEGHIGTLLANLQSMRHLTTLETRLLQIQDEYQLLREFANSPANKNAHVDMTELIDHLKDQLELNKVPIPDTMSSDTQQTAFGLELLTKQFEELVGQLKQAEPDSPAQMSLLRRLDDLIFTETSASCVCSLGIMDMILSVLRAPTFGTNGKQWLRLLAILTAYQSGRSDEKKQEVIGLAVSFAMDRDLQVQEMGVWALANFSDSPSPEEQAMLGQRVLATLVPIVKSPKSDLLLHHALRCLTNLACDAANRKVIDAWFGIDDISRHLDSTVEAIQIQALWCLSHLASDQLVASFERAIALVKRICALLKTRGNSHSLMAAAWRFVSNLISVPSHRALLIQQGIFDHAQQVIVNELEEIEADQERDLSMLQEAVACVASFIAREEALRDAVSAPLLHNFIRLLACNSAATRAQAVWALAYMSVSDKNHPRILAESGLELALDMLDGEEQEQYAAAWLVCNFAGNPEAHDRLRENGALISLVKLLFTKSQDIRLVAGKALSRLSTTSKNKTLVRQLFSTLSLKDDVLSGKSA